MRTDSQPTCHQAPGAYAYLYPLHRCPAPPPHVTQQQQHHTCCCDGGCHLVDTARQHGRLQYITAVTVHWGQVRWVTSHSMTWLSASDHKLAVLLDHSRGLNLATILVRMADDQSPTWVVTEPHWLVTHHTAVIRCHLASYVFMSFLSDTVHMPATCSDQRSMTVAWQTER